MSDETKTWFQRYGKLLQRIDDDDDDVPPHHPVVNGGGAVWEAESVGVEFTSYFRMSVVGDDLNDFRVVTEPAKDGFDVFLFDRLTNCGDF